MIRLSTMRLAKRQLAAMACIAVASSANAGQVTLFSYNGGGFIPPGQSNQAGPGFVRVEASTGAFYGQANAYEFLGGIGVSAFATSRALNMEAQATASFSQSITVVCPLADANGDLNAGCLLPFSIVADGMTSATGAPASNNPQVFGGSVATYNFDWTIRGPGNNLSGFAVVDERSLDDGRHTLDIQGNPLSSVHVLSVNNGDRITITLKAYAGAFSDNAGDGQGSAVADFSHTLRLGGVSGATGANGALLAPNSVHLLGDDGFDYINAAPPNPFTTPVPEPTTWVMMLAGAGLLAMRRPLWR